MQDVHLLSSQDIANGPFKPGLMEEEGTESHTALLIHNSYGCSVEPPEGGRAWGEAHSGQRMQPDEDEPVGEPQLEITRAETTRNAAMSQEPVTLDEAGTEATVGGPR
ncbi:hypothetical protein NDU88_005377 [Pleurodeles waltl]|uniref:Uncharacterized protein n=1 Tax=Pleurodeles waltl TaxID=8319 RepID=A0AAV7WD75_PLEWA|nr:hypothetical protein NDU88_005377 [Pleurodeles waltl]